MDRLQHAHADPSRRILLEGGVGLKAWDQPRHQDNVPVYPWPVNLSLQAW